MRKFVDGTEREVEAVICNRCGRSMKTENGILKEGCFHGDSVFGYFSRRDGKRHRFDLCEDCYNKIIADFAVAVEEADENELL